jgi:putative DNA primase/helicase
MWHRALQKRSSIRCFTVIILVVGFFGTVLCGGKPDRQLEEKLRAEAPGILRWMIQGCLDWQKNGLVRPDIIVQATQEYFDDQDLFGQWLDECCDVDRDNPHKWETAAELFKSWKDYAETAGERSGTTKSLSAALLSRGFAKKRVTGGKTAYVGLRLKRLRHTMDD